MRIRPILVMALAMGLTLVGVSSQAQAGLQPTKKKVTVVSGEIEGAPADAQMLLILKSGASAYAKIKDGKFAIKAPKLKSKAANLAFSLHVIDGEHSYAGPISFGKNTKLKSGKVVKKWYGNATAKTDAVTTLPKIKFSKSNHFGSVMLTNKASAIAATGVLKGADAKTGEPAGAGRLGLAPKRNKKGPLWVQRRELRAALDPGADSSPLLPGADLDSDGLSNSLDIDDDGDGYADPVDPSSGSSGSQPTAQYDAFSGLGSGIGTGRYRMKSPINFNIMRGTGTDAEITAELAQLVSANFVTSIRAVAPFFTETMGNYIKAAWVDCTGLAWCMSEDDDTNGVDAPRIIPFGDGDIGSIWSYAYTDTPGSPCSIHAMGDCKDTLWADFNNKQFLVDSKTNGNSNVDDADIALVGDQGNTPQGFGLYDPWVLRGAAEDGGKGQQNAGFDLTAQIEPRGNAKFFDNFKAGDVFTINALLKDGTTTSIAMTVAPYFVSTPTVTSFTPGGAAEIPVDYTPGNDPNCASHSGNDDCRLGSEGKPFNISAANPTLTLTFWRPQRLRVPVMDDAIGGGELMVDMGGLDYRLSVYPDGGQWYDCPNSAVQFTDSDSNTWAELPKPDNAMSNDHEYMTDTSKDARASTDRLVTVIVDFRDCGDLPVSAGDTKISVRLEADSQPTFGGNRGSTNQEFYFRFN